MKTDYIRRDLYFDRIRPFIQKPIIKILTGQRRVGKSFLFYQLIDYLERDYPEANIIYINKEDFQFDSIKSYSDLISFVETKKAADSNFLFIDEVQEIDHFEKALRHFTLDHSLDIYCTGSNAKLLSGELATGLSGRYIEFRIYSLSYLEFLEFMNIENSPSSLQKYLYWGGLPFIKNLARKDEVISEYLRNIYSTIVYKDIVNRFHIRNPHFLENLVRFLASNTGSVISAKKISDYLKSQQVNMSPQIVLNYLSYLEQALLVYKVKRTNIGRKKVFELLDKYYFQDWGIMNSIIGFAQFDIGKVIENVIYTHLLINGYHVNVGKLGEKEIDFVAEKEGNKIYVQATYLITDEKVKQREFGNLQEIKDNYPKMVVSMDEYAPQNVEGIRHVHLRDFLSQTL
jgi:predicted AAA+ superfamily ATPase